MLPQVNLNPLTKDMDTNKQFASLRNQISQLRDEVDQALSQIGYDNLTLELRKKIDRLETEITGNANLANMVAESVKAKYVRTEVLEADMAIVRGDISSINGNISTINGNIYSINGDISTLQGNISTLNGNITTINGNISTINGTVSGLRGEFNLVKADYVKASELGDNVVTAITGKRVDVMNLNAQNSVVAGGFFMGTSRLIKSQISIGGTSYNIVTWEA